MENTLTVTFASGLHCPKGLTFSAETFASVDRAVALAQNGERLSKEERKAALAKAKEEFDSLRKALKASIKETTAKIEKESDEEIKRIDEECEKNLAEAQARFAALETKGKAETRDYNNSVKGIQIVAKRAKIKENNARELRVKDEQVNLEYLYNDYAEVRKALCGSHFTPLVNAQRGIDLFCTTFSFKKFITNKQMWINLIPFLMLMALIAAFYIAKSITNYGGNMDDVINNGVFIAVVATGAVFIYSSGSFDMSLGPASLMCATCAGILWNNTHNLFVSFIVAILIGALLGIVNAILANMLNLPVMVMTLTMMNILNAIHAVILQGEGNQLFVDEGMGGSPIIYATFLVGFFLLLWAIFNYTKIGRRNKFIGSNATAAKYNGISLMKAGIVSFAISGIGLGICGFLFAMSKSGSSYSTGTILDTIGLNVVIAIVFGGMTTSGGPRSRVSCAIIGAFFCIFLDELFRAVYLADYRFLAKGVIFLVISFFNMYSSRTKMLAR